MKNPEEYELVPTEGDAGERPANESEGEGSPKEPKPKDEGKREQWDNRIQFLLTLVGYAIGLGSVWRFPYLVARNGGIAFILLYVLMLFVIGVPLFYLEVTLGQAMNKGPIAVWSKIAPGLTGIGIAMTVVNVYIILYYTVIIGWIDLYLVSSFSSSPLPWAKCFGCTVTSNASDQQACLLQLGLGTRGNVGSTLQEFYSCWNDSTKYYWYNTALGASGSIGNAGEFNWKVFLAIFITYLVIYLCIFRGLAWAGKVIYVTATLPLLVLLCLFFRAVTLPGAASGLKCMVIPDEGMVTRKLQDPQMWLEASTQVFFALGLAMGPLIGLSSHSTRSHHVLRDAILIGVILLVVSLFSAIVVFSVVGFKAQLMNVDSCELVKAQGTGMIFVVLTEALNHMPGAPFWSVLFFFMLLLLGVDSQLGSINTLVTILTDWRPLAKVHTEYIAGFVCTILFLFTVPFTFGNGVYLFDLFDRFAATLPLLLIGLFEFVAVAWVFGVGRFFVDVAEPINRWLQYIWVVLWTVVNPLIMAVIVIGSIIIESLEPLTYTLFRKGRETSEQYPYWAAFLGAVIVFSSVLAIPLYMIVRLLVVPEARKDAIQFLVCEGTPARKLVESSKHSCSKVLCCRGTKDEAKEALIQND
ncbi:hypothetical protein EMCRGX_G031812 [Ephydatia muelleri]